MCQAQDLRATLPNGRAAVHQGEGSTNSSSRQCTTSQSLKSCSSCCASQNSERCSPSSTSPKLRSHRCGAHLDEEGDRQEADRVEAASASWLQLCHLGHHRHLQVETGVHPLRIQSLHQ